jgi:hypothetical protein
MQLLGQTAEFALGFPAVLGHIMAPLCASLCIRRVVLVVSLRGRKDRWLGEEGMSPKQNLQCSESGFM